jgi:hypothetical protein
MVQGMESGHLLSNFIGTKSKEPEVLGVYSWTFYTSVMMVVCSEYILYQGFPPHNYRRIAIVRNGDSYHVQSWESDALTLLNQENASDNIGTYAKFETAIKRAKEERAQNLVNGWSDYDSPEASNILRAPS